MSSSIFKPRTEASHWYYPDGRPCHEVPYADKKRAGEMRPTTLADARKLGLVASVTNLLNVIANPSLQQWKAQQLLLAAMTLPRMTGESEQDYVDRIITDSESYTAGAAQFGHRIHAAIETYLCEGEVSTEPDIMPQLEPVYQWIEDNIDVILGTEFVVSGQGFSGRLDLHCELKGRSGDFIVDFKTRSPFKGNLSARDSDLWQLCGYRLGYGDKRTKVASLIVCRDNPMPPVLTIWDDDKVETGTKIFKSARSLWHLKNNMPLNESADAF